MDVGNVPLTVIPREPKDRHVLETLFASGADYLVTGDRKDLLSLGLPQLVAAADFADRLSAFDSLAPPAPDSDH